MPPSPQTLRRNGEAPAGTPSSSPRPRLPPPIPLTATPSPHHHHPAFHSTVSLQKLRRFNCLVLVFRIVTFACSVSSSVFMLTNSRSGSDSLHWFDFDAFRFVMVAGAIVALYSLFEMVASIWEITRSTTLFPEFLQVWFDFGHDQVFAYMLLSAESAGTELAKTLMRTDTCSGATAFCLQTDISVALGFVAFFFLALCSLLSGFRVVSFLLNGSRFNF